MTFVGTRIPDFRNVGSLDYDAYWQTRGFALNAKLKEREEIILDYIPTEARVLDIGCGNSRLPVALTGKGCSVTVGDISTKVLEGFRAINIPTIHIDLDRIHESVIEGTYDYIIMSEVLEHTRNPEDIIRALMPHAAHFVLTIPNSAFYRYRLHLLLRGRFFTQWAMHPSEHLRFWSHCDFLDWLGAMGLLVERPVASNGFSFFGLLPGLKNAWKNLFGHQMVYFCTRP